MLSYSYDTGYLAGGAPQAISFSLPLQEAPPSGSHCPPFFSGLLPDESARQHLAGALGISAGNAFGLLEVIGGECAGALSLYPAGQAPASSDDDGVEKADPCPARRNFGQTPRARSPRRRGGRAAVARPSAGQARRLSRGRDNWTRQGRGGRPRTL
ncbi:HipA N-terminal domain-containing protein [Bradyrhizobium sp. DN5]|uniref:HipA N-terminal domain-containing protein n=1 Tax=Bradyrhizobium sp. DN5 TaxID=3056950 RepID=UPI003526B52B